MSGKKWIALLASVMAMSLAGGCGDDDGDNGDAAGTYAGTWTGNVCGRGLTMVLTQSGDTLSGTYTLTGPVFVDTCSGTVSGGEPPSTALLRSTGGHNFWFDIVFQSANTLTGGYYKDGALVCNVTARK